MYLNSMVHDNEKYAMPFFLVTGKLLTERYCFLVYSLGSLSAEGVSYKLAAK